MSRVSELHYKLDDKPGRKESFLVAIQHVLASFIGIIIPILIIGGVLGLGDKIPYLISMALIASGVGTIIQAKSPFGIGAGMISVQGTSFAFLSSMLAAGFMVKARGGGPDDILAMMFGISIVGSFIEILLSQFIHKLKRVITPIVTGTVITIIGISLVKVGFVDMAGGEWLLKNKPELFASPENMFLSFLVIASIIVAHKFGNQWVRLSSIVIGMAVGLFAAILLGKVDLHSLIQVKDVMSVPVPFKYGFSFDWAAFIPVAFIYLIAAIESSGDLTANRLMCQLPIKGDDYIKTIRGGILGDGVSSLIAGVFSALPNTTFAQNNGVIQITGVASRYIGVWIGGILIVLGLFPQIGAILRVIPSPIIGGATMLMFSTIAIAGMKILQHVNLNTKNMLIVATSFGLGIGVLLVPEVVDTVASHIGGETGEMFKNIFGSSITVGGITAIVMSLVLGDYSDSYDPIVQEFPIEETDLNTVKA